MKAPRRVVQVLVLATSLGLAGWVVSSASAKPRGKASKPDAGAASVSDGGTPSDGGTAKSNARKEPVFFPATKAPLGGYGPGGLGGGTAMGDSEGLSGGTLRGGPIDAGAQP